MVVSIISPETKPNEIGCPSVGLKYAEDETCPSLGTGGASVGSLTVADVAMGLTGQSFSASVGSISPVDMQVGLTGQSATFNIGTVNIFAYGDVDTGSNTSYSDVSTGSNDTYSDVATGSNTSYSDAA